MKLTESYIKQLINEEMNTILSEATPQSFRPGAQGRQAQKQAARAEKDFWAQDAREEKDFWAQDATQQKADQDAEKDFWASIPAGSDTQGKKYNYEHSWNEDKPWKETKQNWNKEWPLEQGSPLMANLQGAQKHMGGKGMNKQQMQDFVSSFMNAPQGQSGHGIDPGAKHPIWSGDAGQQWPGQHAGYPAQQGPTSEIDKINQAESEAAYASTKTDQPGNLARGHEQKDTAGAFELPGLGGGQQGGMNLGGLGALGALANYKFPGAEKMPWEINPEIMRALFPTGLPNPFLNENQRVINSAAANIGKRVKGVAKSLGATLGLKEETAMRVVQKELRYLIERGRLDIVDVLLKEI